VAIAMVSITADIGEKTASNSQPMPRWFAGYSKKNFAARRVAVELSTR